MARARVVDLADFVFVRPFLAEFLVEPLLAPFDVLGLERAALGLFGALFAWVRLAGDGLVCVALRGPNVSWRVPEWRPPPADPRLPGRAAPCGPDLCGPLRAVVLRFAP